MPQRGIAGDPQRRGTVRLLDAARAMLSSVSPHVAALLVFLCGSLALATLMQPQIAARVELLSRIVPLGLIEVSHFLAAISATVMLFLAYGLARRRAMARRSAMLVCFMLAALALLNGLAWEESAMLIGVGILLWATAPAYYRRPGAGAARLGGWWTIAALCILLAAAWLGFAVYEEVPYSHALWFTFLIEADAARFLRALLGVIIAAAVILLLRLLAVVRGAPPDALGLDAADAFLQRQTRLDPEAWLAMTGDKRFFFSKSGQSLIMYAVAGRSWIAMGGPIGPPEERRDLIWKFREAADREDAWPAFYSVGPDLLPDLLDAGFVLQKIGEAAIVPLESFSLEGGKRYRLRQTRVRGRREELDFSVERLTPGGAFESELRAVSDAWMANRRSAEKSFSLGRFDPVYLARFPVAVLRQKGRVVAFANLWPGTEAIGIDLMRCSPDAPRSAMEVLILEAILWSVEQGYRWFDLGRAPLSGLEDRPFASWMSRVGAFIYRHGEPLYGFSGLRAFKQKFDPLWSPRYLAAPGPVRLSAALLRATRLTSGGIIGLLRPPRRP
jgi:phosphatidylglycerol lysyltransferase